ncbi:DUF6284 family protein [Micromonospora sp. NBC_01813]|uniref:DUF6284 family protein n=1 Tax=Micromonospora sp. NBC_01813 TaxID=2975988 RepID=UPI002DDA6069|nr:DUF6284 family protein [Micromonospora sp. NBC_01813]WSA06805.1 DUF6284 family protein [Micromonospora sp. NBC_01813]
MNHDDRHEPSASDLAAIEAEWPLIAADLDALDAEIALIVAADSGGPTELDWRRHRRAATRVTRVAADITTRRTYVRDPHRAA